jgi:uncharacterized membrane protein HdeD (DUF308 family)
MATASRPIGVTIVAVIAWLNGVWNIIQGILGVIAGFATWNVLGSWLLVFIGALTVVVSLGLFRGNPSARLVVAIVFVVGALVAGALIAAGSPLWSGIPTIVLGLVGIVLLYTGRANAFFRS